MPWIWPTTGIRNQRGQNGQIKFWEKQGCTNRNRCTDTCNLACTDPLVNHNCTKKVGHPDLLLSSLFRQSQTYLCAVFLEPAVIKFASWVHRTWMQSNLGFDLLCRVTWAQNVRVKFWENQGGTSPNRCTQTLWILHAQTHYRTQITHQKVGHPDLFSWSKSSVNKTGRELAFSSQLSFTAHGLLVVISIVWLSSENKLCCNWQAIKPESLCCHIAVKHILKIIH